MPQDKTGHFYYSWFPTIYQRDTQDLSLAECGAYRRLIDHYMLTRSPLPGNSDRAMSRILGVGLDEYLQVKPALEALFKPSNNPVGSWSHTFCDEQLGKQAERLERNRRNGKGGGRPKKVESNENNPVGSQSKPRGTYTEQSKAVAKESIKTPLPPELSALVEKDLNVFENALAACSLLMGVAQLNIEDQQTLCGWLERYDMNRLVMPTVAQQIITYKRKNQGQRPKSLAYFTPRLAERAELEELSR